MVELFEILTYPNEFLKKSSRQVENIDEDIQLIIDRMAATMYHAPGVGLAAIQVGIDLSIIVYDISAKDEEPDLQVLINPVIVESSGSTVTENEGCLSVPDLQANVKRHEFVRVNALDRHGNSVQLEAKDLLAIVLQHEIDHLNGVLFIDRISSLKRNMYKKRVKKQIKRNERKKA